ncbi:hypothetical protein EDEG_01628 [Edhazardia aedis USNM 41457]|uniref:Uncharacterized protein n=1 Tax=Edhazardia aedis (strain USNM 41457) TaxID=1003232 RepID=J9DRY6_EDHAE|nr:hypothetical protein EDEG_01628 [Edhazardia aedis USNM 41457]|eukprot:EJW04052.1 hypothetical protein EDEG_01628 [Edhazardia aedis USNM 41457]
MHTEKQKKMKNNDKILDIYTALRLLRLRNRASIEEINRKWAEFYRRKDSKKDDTNRKVVFSNQIRVLSYKQNQDSISESYPENHLLNNNGIFVDTIGPKVTFINDTSIEDRSIGRNKKEKRVTFSNELIIFYYEKNP